MNKYLRFMYACCTVGLVLALQLAVLGPASAAAKSQEDISVSIQVKNKNIEDVFATLSAKTGLSFHYDKSECNVKQKITLNCVNEPLEEVLYQLSTQTGLKFTRKNNKIIVRLPGIAGNNALESVTLDGKGSLVINVKGTVKDAKGSPIPGVTVMVKGTNNGTQTGPGGTYSLQANVGEILVFRSMGYNIKEAIIPTSGLVDVVLEDNVKALSEFVVTALGIQKKSKELTYATQQLNGDELSKVKDANVINSLAGKAAGVTITRSASGIGGSARVVLRGNKSTRENQPLYIIDGVPMANFSPAQPTDVWGQANGIAVTGGRDGGDGISNINPDDIETINILKGASAAALYGSQAANGVIIITTKKGKSGRVRIDVSSDFTVESVMKLPELQYKYGQTEKPGATPGTPESWGEVVNAPNHVDDFFNKGNTWNNSISLSGGSEKAQTYFSYSNTNNKGILPSSEFKRHTLNFRESLRLLNDKLTVDANITFVNQKSHNRLSPGIYYNPLPGLYLFPRGQDFDDYATHFEGFVPSRNFDLQRWWNIDYSNPDADNWRGRDDQQNPYWVLYRTASDDNRDRAMTSITAKYQLTDWLNVQARGSFDKSYDQYELKANAGTQIVIAPANGRYINEKERNTQLYADLIFNLNKKLSENWRIGATVGTSITDTKMHDRNMVGVNQNASPGLEYANKFSIANIQANALDAQHSIQRRQLQALFGSVQVGLKDYLFLDLTGRNDWSSTFAFTPTMSSGFFYYSAGITNVISDMLSLPSFINFAKIRASYAQVGNDIAPYSSRPGQFSQQILSGVGRVTFNTRTPLPGIYMKPEKNESFEIGFETRMFDDKVNLDFTYYVNNNFNQYMEVPAPVGSGYTIYYLNLGNIRNHGVEAMLTLTPLRTNNFRWNSSFNFAANRNKIVKLSDPDVPGASPSNMFTLTQFGVNMYGSFIREGGSWGDIYANRELAYNDEGQLLVKLNSQTNRYEPVINTLSQEPKKVGNPNPDFMLGWNNSFDYKDLSVSFLIDGRFGGKVMSVTQSVLDAYGVSKVTANARDNGGVPVNAFDVENDKAVSSLDPRDYYFNVGGRAGIGELYMYDATSIRLRELAISYKLPLKAKWLRDVRLGIIGRNLFFFKCDAPFDPELSMGTGNGLQGIDVFGLPATRSLGVNLKVGF